MVFVQEEFAEGVANVANMSRDTFELICAQIQHFKLGTLTDSLGDLGESTTADIQNLKVLEDTEIKLFQILKYTVADVQFLQLGQLGHKVGKLREVVAL